MNRILYVLLLIIIFFRPLSVLYDQRETLFARNYNYPLYKSLYYNSQYVKKDKPNIVPDQVLESFAAGTFLHGVNPISIIHDQPPLGRYINAFSIFFFDNTSTIAKFLLFVSLLGLILISNLVIGRNWISLIPIVLFANESLFLSKFSLALLLEPIQFPFIVFCLYSFMRGVKGSNKWFIIVSVLLGCIISIRYFVLGAALLISFLLYFWFNKKQKKFIFFCLTLPLSLGVLFVSYFKTIEQGASFLKIIGIQKYIFSYHQSAFTLPFSFWDLLLFDRLHTWWGNQAILSDPLWIVTWPISVGIIIYFLFRFGLKKIKLSSSELMILLWVILYSLMLSVGYSSTRYFLPLIPFLYILAVGFLFRTFSKR